MKGTKKPRTFVFMYVCGVCVCQYMCKFYYVFEYGDRFCMALWQVADVILLLHSGPVGSAARSQRCCC